MPKYDVRSEFVDIHTGNRILPGGDPFEPRDSEQYDRLVAARCITAEPAVLVVNDPTTMGRKELEDAAIDVVRSELASASDDDLRTMIQRFLDKADGDADIALSKMKVDDLKALAFKEEIDLGDATKKDDIIAAIELAREAKAS